VNNMSSDDALDPYRVAGCLAVSPDSDQLMLRDFALISGLGGRPARYQSGVCYRRPVSDAIPRRGTADGWPHAGHLTTRYQKSTCFERR